MNKVLQVISDLSHLHNLNLGISPGENVAMGQNCPEFAADFVLMFIPWQTETFHFEVTLS